jgi:geranylgeranyl pyrophosphate synthase
MTDMERRAVERLLHAQAPTEGEIAAVIDAVARAGGLSYARARAEQLGEQADAELDHLPSSPARDALRASITYVLDRRR